MVTAEQVRMVPSGFTIEKTLPVGVYNVDLIPFQGWVLEPYAKKFVFGYDIYNLQNDFVDYVCKTYNEMTGNLGILLNGIKGTGKTVTAKELANRLNLPVIIVKSFGDQNQSLIEYLSTFNCDCIFFFDEFEKNFNEGDSTILQFMDGVYNSKYRKIFLLTTNTLSINPNLVDRTSRIRYVNTFGNLDISVVKAYLNDFLKDKSCINELIEFIDTLTISTIDILKTIVEEVNCHGIESFRKSKGFLNVTPEEYNYSLYMCHVPLPNFELARKREGEHIYTIDNFVESVRSRMQYEEQKFTASEEQLNDINEAYRKIRQTSPFKHSEYRNWEYNVKFKNLRVGDNTYYGEIIAIDYDKRVIVFKDEPCNDVWFAYVLNPDVTPSLYKHKTPSAF